MQLLRILVGVILLALSSTVFAQDMVIPSAMEAPRGWHKVNAGANGNVYSPDGAEAVQFDSVVVRFSRYVTPERVLQRLYTIQICNAQNKPPSCGVPGMPPMHQGVNNGARFTTGNLVLDNRSISFFIVVFPWGYGVYMYKCPKEMTSMCAKAADAPISLWTQRDLVPLRDTHCRLRALPSIDLSTVSGQMIAEGYISTGGDSTLLF